VRRLARLGASQGIQRDSRSARGADRIRRAAGTVRPVAGGVAPRFEGLLKGSRVSFWFRTDDPYAPFGGGNPILNDRIDDRKFFTVDGDANGTMAASPDVRFAGILQGTIRAMSLDAPDVECRNSKNSKNQFSLVHQ
jgi:hypothetical protein